MLFALNGSLLAKETQSLSPKQARVAENPLEQDQAHVGAPPRLMWGPLLLMAGGVKEEEGGAATAPRHVDVCCRGLLPSSTPNKLFLFFNLICVSSVEDVRRDKAVYLWKFQVPLTTLRPGLPVSGLTECLTQAADS